VDDFAFAHRLTTGYGLIQLPFSVLADRLAGFEPGGSEVWLFTRPENGAAALGQLIPLSHPARRYLVVPIGSSWCAVVDNGRDGPEFADFQRWIEPWSDVVTVRVVDQSAKTVVANGFRERMAWEARILEIRGPQLRRSITCANDGGRWVFERAGDPLPIEAGFPYEARRKADRFGSAQLGAVLDYLGARPLSAADLLDAKQLLILTITDRDPLVQQRMERSDCTLEEAEDPAFGYWLRATTWIDHLETHAESAVFDLARAVALNPSYAKRARPHLKRARSVLGARAYEDAMGQAMSLLQPQK
jgi:hypothetical protein